MSGKAALLATYVPIIGLILDVRCCCGHRISVLGPSMFYVGSPIAFALSLWAFDRAKDRLAACVAFAVSMFECSFVLFAAGEFIYERLQH